MTRTTFLATISSLRALATTASRIQAWANCAEARARTRSALRPLERTGWRVSDGITLPAGGRVDHLVVGPSGVFVLDSRAWSGVVTVDRKGATITPPDDPATAWTEHGQHTALPPLAAALVRATSTAAGNAVVAPHVVVVVWAPFPDRLAHSGGVTYVAGDHLADWLSGQPRQLDGRQLVAWTVGAETMRMPHPRRPLATGGTRIPAAHQG